MTDDAIEIECPTCGALCMHGGDGLEGEYTAIVPDDRAGVLAERAAIVRWIRNLALAKRSLAATYLTDKAVAGRVNKEAEVLGRLANKIDRGEHRGPKQ